MPNMKPAPKMTNKKNPAKKPVPKTSSKIKTVLCLRTCKADHTSHNKFTWPSKIGSLVEVADFDPAPVCGKGLHGLLWGEGAYNLLDWSPEAIWQVVEVEEKTLVDLDGKVKFPKCKLVFEGDQKTATDYLQLRAPNGKVIHGAFVTVGHNQTATAGNYGHATAGDYGHATAGDYGQATAGDGGHATAGDGGQATAGDYGHATAGNYGHATAGNYGHATAGDYGHATAGDGGQATAGDYGTITIKWYAESRDRLLVGYIGEEGLEPNVPYRVFEGKFVKVPA